MKRHPWSARWPMWLARPPDPKQPKVAGHLVQTSLLVAGDNQRPVWTHTTDAWPRP